jgi:lysophospholipid acyltransferase (LPLAT)-like uncharacterized protein
VKRDPLFQRLTPPLAAALVRGLGMTLRLTVEGVAEIAPLWHSGRPVIYALWHGQLLMVPWLNARLRRIAGARPARVLASRSRDGELVTRYVQQFGIEVIRGSTSRGGMGAARALLAALQAGEDIAVVPDGPRGPRRHAQPGVVALAALSGAPIVPLGFAASPAWRLSTWDGFIVPMPFARAAATIGAPLVVDRDADRGRALKDLEEALSEIVATAEQRVGT